MTDYKVYMISLQSQDIFILFFILFYTTTGKILIVSQNCLWWTYRQQNYLQFILIQYQLTITTFEVINKTVKKVSSCNMCINSFPLKTATILPSKRTRAFYQNHLQKLCENIIFILGLRNQRGTKIKITKAPRGFPDFFACTYRGVFNPMLRFIRK